MVDFKDLKILVGEEDRDLGNAISRFILRNGGKVTLAYDGVQVINNVNEREFDLYILDERLSRIECKDVIKMIRVKSTSPILCLVESGNMTSKVLKKNFGYNELLIRPFKESDLIEKINECLSLRMKDDVEEKGITISYRDGVLRKKDRKTQITINEGAFLEGILTKDLVEAKNFEEISIISSLNEKLREIDAKFYIKNEKGYRVVSYV